MIALLEAWAVGLCVSVPVGAVAVVCVRRAITRGVGSGVLAGLGAACADALLALGVVRALDAMQTWVELHGTGLRLGGGSLLLAVGVYALRAHPSAESRALRHPGAVAAFTFTVSVLNPASVLALAALLATFGLVESSASRAGPGLVAAGVFLGAMTWWLLLSVSAARLRGRFGAEHLRALQRVSAGLLIACGALALALARGPG